MVNQLGKMREKRECHNFVGIQYWVETAPEELPLDRLTLRLEHLFQLVSTTTAHPFPTQKHTKSQIDRTRRAFILERKAKKIIF